MGLRGDVVAAAAQAAAAWAQSAQKGRKLAAAERRAAAAEEQLAQRSRGNADLIRGIERLQVCVLHMHCLVLFMHAQVLNCARACPMLGHMAHSPIHTQPSRHSSRMKRCREAQEELDTEAASGPLGLGRHRVTRRFGQEAQARRRQAAAAWQQQQGAHRWR